jgi:uncharacterized repeat protein (TIGR01451 family)
MVEQSCIVDNSDTAVVNDSSTIIDVENNWWGAPDGPSGAGSGAGDSISGNVDFTPFLTTPILDCPTREADLAFGKGASLSNAVPGQPLSFILTITNTGPSTVNNITVQELLPAGFILSDTFPSHDGITLIPNGFVVGNLALPETVSVEYEGMADPTLTGDTVLDNSALLTHTLVGTRNAQASVNVVVPVVGWSQGNYGAGEADGSVPVTVTLTPPNPYSATNVQVVYTDSAEGFIFIAATQLVTIPAGSSSVVVNIPFDDDEVYESRTIALELQGPTGATLAESATATISLTEDDTQASLAISKVADLAQASVGDTINYTYRITNTGPVTLTTVTATDNRLGTVEGLAGALVPAATRSAIIAYLVQPGDVGTLVNTVTVTGTDALGGTVVAEDSVTVTVTEAVTPNPQTFLPSVER